MFADSLLDSRWQDRSRRKWTALLSFSLQAGVIVAGLLLPLMHPQFLPQLRHLPQEFFAPEPPAAAPPAISTHRVQSNLSGSRLLTPREIPHSVRQIVETMAPPAPELDALAVPGGITGGRGVVPHGIVDSAALRPPQPKPTSVPPARVVQVSRVMEGYLAHKVMPVYPPIAIQTRIQGEVVLQAIISKDGTIENLQVMSGHPLLIRAALDAVRQWRYRPYYLNEVPVEVETRIVVNFTLSPGG